MKYGRSMAKIRAFSANAESFINRAVAEGFELTNVEHGDGGSLSFEVPEKMADRLESRASGWGVKLEICYAATEHKRLFKSRGLLLLFAAVAGISLLLSSLFIWQIDVRGNNRLSRGEILRALEDSNVSVGSFWPGIKADTVRSCMMLALPDIAWMTLNISGSRAVLLLNERQTKPAIYDSSKAADIVASKNGIIRRVSVLSGRPCVEQGQAVTEGEILVSHSLSGIMGKERSECPRATIMADTWYEYTAICPQETELKAHSGLRRHRFALQFGKRRINFYFSSGKAIDECDKIINEYALGIEGQFALPVKLLHECIVSYQSSGCTNPESREIRERLMAELVEQTDGQILESSFTESSVPGLYVLTLRAHCIENIALLQDTSG